ncbi:MAG: hypothetical protein WEA82_00320 [Idiomarina sp.]
MSVITGDIINSRDLDSNGYSQVLAELKRELSRLRSQYQAASDVYRGDSFQVALNQPWLGLRIAVLIRLKLKGNDYNVDARQSISIASVNELRKDVKLSTGKAFVFSGQALDEMKSNALTFSSDSDVLNFHIPVAIRLLDVLLNSLTSAQSEALYCYLTNENSTHKELALKLNKNRANVTKLLNSSQYLLVADTLKYYESLVKRELDDDR